MKLRLRADSKDAIIFVIFAIFLLYLVAIGVLNLSSFASFGKFYGLNPIKAFTGEFIAPTIVFYLIALISLFVTTGSYFFDLEEGFGLSIGTKKEKGYSRWATPNEMKKQLKRVLPLEENSKYGGIPLINNGKEIWVDDGEYHNLVIGATGSGKTTAIILPMVRLLAKNNESMIITDPKGEIYEKMSVMLKSRGYNIVLLNFRNPQNGNSWNPLSMPYDLYKKGNQDKAMELLDDLALNILYDETNKNADPFWEKTSADYFSGIALGLFEDADPSQININSISLMSTVGEEKFGGSTYIKEYFNSKDPNGAAFINASSTIMAPSETKGSILAVFKQKIKLFASRENLSEMLSRSDFDLADIGRKKTALFIIIQDEKKTYHSLATILLKQCYETLIDVAQANGGKLPVRTNFLVDEFANMPPLKDITTMITAARSRRIRFTLIIQNFAQLNEVYGKENAETIKGNCGNMVYLISTELAALEEISKMCGEVKSKEKDKTASTPLVTVTDLQKLKLNEVIIRRLRLSPFKTKLTADYEMNWGKTYPKGEYPVREKNPVNVFDIRTFVKEKKKAKMNELLNMDIPGDTGGFRGNMPPFFNPNMFNPSPAPNPFGMDMGLGDMGGNINIDDLVKKIDQKIAELEEEEKRNNAALKGEAIDVTPKTESITPSLDSSLDKIENKISDIEAHPVLPSMEQTKESVSSITEQPVERVTNIIEEPIKNNIYFEPIKEERIEPSNINYRDIYGNSEIKTTSFEKANEDVHPKSVFDILEKNDFDLPKVEAKPIIEEKKEEVVKPKIELEQEVVQKENIVNNTTDSTAKLISRGNQVGKSFNWFDSEDTAPTYTASRRNVEQSRVDVSNAEIIPNISIEEAKPIDTPVIKPVVEEKMVFETDDLFKPKPANVSWFSEHEEEIKNSSLSVKPENIEPAKSQEEPVDEDIYDEITDDQFFDDFFDD